MALVKFGAGIIQMLGSVGGTTFGRNPCGNYARARTKPIDPQKPRQMKVRTSMSSLCTLWSAFLTPEQRTAWNDYASKQIMKNRLGEACKHSGFNHFIRSNMIMVQSDMPIYADGPVFDGLPAHDPDFEITASEVGEYVEVNFNNGMDWASETRAYMFVFQGMPQNKQRNFFAGPWRLLGYVGGKDADPPHPPVPFIVQYYHTAGQRQWVYARIIRKDGRLSEPFRADCFVGP